MTVIYYASIQHATIQGFGATRVTGVDGFLMFMRNVCTRCRAYMPLLGRNRELVSLYSDFVETD